MYNITWDTKINGILLTGKETDVVLPTRPVFFEELNLLGLNKYWKYSDVKEPLLWATGRKYFYKGQLVAKAQGGNIYEDPKISITETGINLELEPINIDKIVKRNKKALFVLENETIDFIDHIYENYKKENYLFFVSFSGGKDSHALLDLVKRVIPNDELCVIFNDTTLENQYTYENLEKTTKEYKKKYPDVKFFVTKPPITAINFINEFGLPSRVHRWCTPVLKTAPINNFIRSKFGDSSKIIVFEGLRAEESARRSTYDRISENIQNLSIVKARPILQWNFSEVILYGFHRKLRLNSSYRFGLSRVGCTLCPHSSQWSEFVSNKIENKFSNEYIPVIKEYAIKRGLTGQKNIKRFIADGEWKKRFGGKVSTNDTSIHFSDSNDYIKAFIINAKENFLEWSKVVGTVFYKDIDPGIISGEIKIDENFCNFKLINKSNKKIIEIKNLDNNQKLKSKFRKILYKTAFCIHCGLCESECSTGALNTQSKVKINTEICNNCGNCLYYTMKGCLVSKSVDVEVGGVNIKSKSGGLYKYYTFGMREEWLNEFLSMGETWLEDNSLGSIQIKAMIRWLIDAELIDHKTKKFTEKGKYLREIYNHEPLFVWSIIWNNIYYNSRIIKWYCDEIEWNSDFTKNELIEKIDLSFPGYSKVTLKNSITELVNTLDRSPLGSKLRMGIIEKKGRVVKSIKKYGTDTINPLVIAYSLYKLSEKYERNDFTISELYDKSCEGGPYKIFGISKDQLKRILRGLQEERNYLLNVDLTADLDNINLREDITSNYIIKIAGEQI